ncbi:hypothetical protein L2E82_06186 [Cichorium intybus]|uniref:Uncharacterized protein n=1 Tax=Cichorium intybus TaxID=13427 RepID=A0ACB9HAP2_CICIN|nr:hypothetical protein L2E82_06186 [Cichorium intybus]
MSGVPLVKKKLKNQVVDFAFCSAFAKGPLWDEISSTKPNQLTFTSFHEFKPRISSLMDALYVGITGSDRGKSKINCSPLDSLRNKSSSCLVRRTNGSSDNGVFTNIKLGIESIEKLIVFQRIEKWHNMWNCKFASLCLCAALSVDRLQAREER